MADGRTHNVGRRRSSRARGDGGSAIVEFAIVFVVLSTIVFGAIDLGRAFFTWNQVKNAAREGAVYAERDPWSQAPSGSSCADPNNIKYRAQHEDGSANTSYVVVTKLNGTAYSGCKADSTFNIDSGDEITVQVTAPFTAISPLGNLIFGDPDIAASVDVVVQ